MPSDAAGSAVLWEYVKEQVERMYPAGADTLDP